MNGHRETRFWFPIGSRDQANQLLQFGALAASLYAACCLSGGYLCFSLGRPILGFRTFSLVDGVFFALVASRLRRSSADWAFAGLLYLAASHLYGYVARGQTGTLAMGAVLFVFFLNAARASWYLRRAKPESSLALAPSLLPHAEDVLVT